MEKGDERPKVGLVLSGGGLRGLAHIGVLKVLEAHGWRPDLVTGVSMGGIVAAAYASGLPLAQIEQEAVDLMRFQHVASLLDGPFRRGALIRGRRLLAYFREKLGQKSFADTEIPLGLLAVDCQSGEQVQLLSGELALAVRATMAFPGVFAPTRWGGRFLMDGGTCDNLPVELARQMGADKVVAVDVIPRAGSCDFLSATSGGSRFLPVPQVIEVLQRGMDILIANLTEVRLQLFPADVLLRPNVPPEVATFSGFSQIPTCIFAGVQAAEEQIDGLAAVFSSD